MRLPRNEYKYLISIEQKRILLELWNKYLVKDAYTDKQAKTPILSMYFDSPNLDFYTEKLDGIMNRSKVRLRVYDYDFKEGIPCFLEIKQRFGDKVRKIRSYRKSLSSSMMNLENWGFEKKIEQDSFGELLSRYKLRPMAQVFYIREAFQAIIEDDLRITFDTSLIGLKPNQKISPELLLNKDRYLMPEGMCILEIKNNSTDLPKWIFEVISKLGLIQRSIPKYISAIENLKINELRLNSGEYI